MPNIIYPGGRGGKPEGQKDGKIETKESPKESHQTWRTFQEKTIRKYPRVDDLYLENKGPHPRSLRPKGCSRRWSSRQKEGREGSMNTADGADLK